MAWTELDYPTTYWISIFAKQSLLHFNGINESITFTDEYGYTWAPSGNAKLNTGNKKFGSASLDLSGAGDFITTDSSDLGAKFTLEGWFHVDNIDTTHQAIVCAINAGLFGLFLAYNRDGDKKLTLFASSDGVSWDIATTTDKGTKVDWVNDTWYKWIIDFDGTTYRVFIGTTGTLNLDISITSSLLICSVTTISLGIYSTTYQLIGGIDEFRGTYRYNYYNSFAIAETTEFAKNILL